MVEPAQGQKSVVVSAPQVRPRSAEPPFVERGVCHVLFAFDVGFSIDLDEAQRRITAEKLRRQFSHKRRAPHYFAYQPAPLRIIQQSSPIAVGPAFTAATVECVLYDFGAIVVRYGIPLHGSVSGLLDLSNDLYDHPALAAHARGLLETLLGPIAPAIQRPRVSELVEDYCIYELSELRPAVPAEALLHEHAELVARILRAESAALSADEVSDALSCRIAYSPEDCVIIDWNAALVVDRAAEDVVSVLEFVNVELLELRFLDDRLDHTLGQAYEAMQRRAGTWRRAPGMRSGDLWRIAQLQMDSAMLFEGVNNTLKLLGDQYLARVYRLASQRFHLRDWDASILRKLQTIESLYEKTSDRQAARRLEMLEWIIIVLIALSIVLPFVPGFGAK